MRNVIDQKIHFVFLTIFSLFCLFSPERAHSNPLNQWKVSCAVDKGSQTKSGNVLTFKTSKNRCKGGTFSQRSEIKSNHISPKHKGTYEFRSTIAFKSSAFEKFDIFQIHDSRSGCAPPLKLTVLKDASLTFISHYQTSDDKTAANKKKLKCDNVPSLTTKYSRQKLYKSGVAQDLIVRVAFNGDGGFKVSVFLDGKFQMEGAYTPSQAGDHYKSPHFYFKHGVYSKNMFDYTLTSADMKVVRVK